VPVVIGEPSGAPSGVREAVTKPVPMERPLVVAVCGSRREGSYTRKALEIALDGAEAAGAETELIDLRTADVGGRPPLRPRR